MPGFRFLVLATAATAGALLAPATATAHDLRAKVTVGAEVRVEAYFEEVDGEPAEFADAVVTDATGAEVAAGKTDERGVWTFPRPKPGTYTLTVKSIGHVATLAFPVEGEPDAPPAVHTGWRMNRALALATGLVLLIGTSAVSWFLGRRRRVK